MKLPPLFEALAACEIAGLDPANDMNWTEEEMQRFSDTVHSLRNTLSVIAMTVALKQRGRA